jgi:hypothetical protein
MTFMTWAERQELLAYPRNLRSYSQQRDWEAARRAELGFPEDSYREGLSFHLRKQGPRFEWALVDRALHLAALKGATPPAPEDIRADLLWDLHYCEAGLLMDGVAASAQEAWETACKVADTDRLEIGHAQPVAGLKRARHRLKEFDRLAALQPEEATAQPQRYVYAEGRYQVDIYDWTREAQARRARFCFRRFRVVKETKLFLFTDLENSEDIDRDGVADEEDAGFKYTRRDVTLTRIRKDLWDAPEQGWDGKERATAGRYVSNSPWGIGWVWLDLKTLVEECDRRTQDFLRGLGNTDPNGGSWIKVLGLEAKEADLSSISRADLQKAYRRAVMRTHPDKGGDAEAFQQVQEAYEAAQRAFATIW